MTIENHAVEDLTGGAEADTRVAVVTGASSGIGLAAAQDLSRRGWIVAIVGRDETRLRIATDQVRAGGSASVTAFRCDFANLSEVRELGRRLRAAYPRIDLLANNAGGTVGTRSTTVDGFEETIQTNHLAPFLLSQVLRDVLRDGRIINTSSMAYRLGRLNPDDLSSAGQSYRALANYGTAKQAAILFAAEAARRWPDIYSASYHPGIVRTRFGADNPLYAFFYRNMPGLRTPAKGAETLVWLATEDTGRLTSGAFYQDLKPRRLTPAAADPDLAARLWEASLTAVGWT